MSKRTPSSQTPQNDEQLQTNLTEQQTSEVNAEAAQPVADAPTAAPTATAQPATDSLAESTASAADEADEKESFGARLKGFFVMLGSKIGTYFVNLGKRFCAFWVRFWHKTVRFFKNVGVFFRMLWSLCVEAKLKLDDKRKARKQRKAEARGIQLEVAPEQQDQPVADEQQSAEAEPIVVTDKQPLDETVVEDSEQEEAVDEVLLMRSKFAHFFRRRTKDEWKVALLGNNEKKGAIPLIICYALLILFGFVYIYPILYMLAYSLMGESDVANPMVTYWPTEWQWSNYREASRTLDFFNTLLQTAYISVLPSIFQTVACGITAYGLARFRFPGKKLIFTLIILTFIIPPQLTMMPQLITFTKFGFSGNVLSYMVPAAFGQGIKSAVFILIFYQFFRGIPDSVVEAAKIDGANSFQIFVKIGIPAAVPAILLSFLLSVVWYYNETVLADVYLGNTVKLLPVELEKFRETFDRLNGTSASGKTVSEAIYMAGTLLNVLPLIIMYFFTQKYFVDGIDKAGITGE